MQFDDYDDYDDEDSESRRYDDLYESLNSVYSIIDTVNSLPQKLGNIYSKMTEMKIQTLTPYMLVIAEDMYNSIEYLDFLAGQTKKEAMELESCILKMENSDYANNNTFMSLLEELTFHGREIISGIQNLMQNYSSLHRHFYILDQHKIAEFKYGFSNN